MAFPLNPRGSVPLFEPAIPVSFDQRGLEDRTGSFRKMAEAVVRPLLGTESPLSIFISVIMIRRINPSTHMDSSLSLVILNSGSLIVGYRSPPGLCLARLAFSIAFSSATDSLSASSSSIVPCRLKYV